MQNNVEVGGGILGLICSLIYVAFIIVVTVGAIAGMWKTFEKADKPGWAAIVPIYNVVILLEISEKPIWWILLMLIPCANLVVIVMISIEVAKKFGKEPIFGVGLAFLGFIFYPILGFGSAQYQGSQFPGNQYPGK